MTALKMTDIRSDDYLSELLELGRLLNSSLDLKQVLETAIESVVRFVNAERGFILLVDTTNGRVWGEAIRGMDEEALKMTLSGQDTENRAEISRTIIDNTMLSGKPMLTHNAMEDPRFAGSQSVQISNLRSAMCVPLIAQGRALGIIYLDNRIISGLFSERQLTMLSAFSQQASVAIENARLYDNLRRSLEDRLKLQDALHKQETQRLALEEAGRLKSDFIGYVAHELRNPLTTIRGYVQTMLQDEDNTLDEDIKREFHEAIEADSDRLLDLINELLDVSRLEAGRPLTLSRGEITLRPLLEKLARRHHFYKFFTKQHTIVTEFGETLQDTMIADEDKLNQIFSNLLSNAIKYSPQGGTITLRASREDRTHVRIEVEDSGLGMSEEQVGRLFRQYERVERDDIRNIPGTGLGLFLIKSLVELHHGTISAKSETGKGSVFSVVLPVGD